MKDSTSLHSRFFHIGLPERLVGRGLCSVGRHLVLFHNPGSLLCRICRLTTLMYVVIYLPFVSNKTSVEVLDKFVQFPEARARLAVEMNFVIAFLPVCMRPQPFRKFSELKCPPECLAQKSGI